MNFAKLLERYPKREPEPPKPHVMIPAVRTDCVSGKSKAVELRCELEFIDSLQSWWLMIRNGVTGYESARAAELFLSDRWPACIGTKNRWDKLVIESEGMAILKNWLSEQPELKS